MAKHVEHQELGEFEGHPVMTALQDANEHLAEALKHTKVGIDRARLHGEIQLARRRLDVLEDAFGKREYQH